MALLIHNMVLLLKDTSQRIKVGKKKLPSVTTVTCSSAVTTCLICFSLSAEKTRWIRRDKYLVNSDCVIHHTPLYLRQ